VDIKTIAAIRRELESELIGRRFGKTFQLSRHEIAVDFRLRDSLYLFVSVEPSAPRIYLIKRRLRDLEKASVNLSPFLHYIRKRLSGAAVTRIEQVPDERVLIVDLRRETEAGEQESFALAVQLTGKSANLFLLDERGVILERFRETRGEGQEVGDIYGPPEREVGKHAGALGDREGEIALKSGQTTLSEELDRLYQEKRAARNFLSLAGAARAKVKQEITKREKLAARLKDDLRHHGDAEKWKRLGDLLLANVSTAERKGDQVLVTDYFDENTPRIEVALGSDESITGAAERFFRRYTKARNAGEEIAKRMQTIDDELAGLYRQGDRIEEAIATQDDEFLNAFLGRDRIRQGERGKAKQPESNSAVRNFISSDGFEILVGKKAKDNDHLTFRMAKSLDLWMHAADYPGSHVLIRNPNRKEIPQRTLLEAAQLAAFYSQGKKQPKAAVHYTQKKFVNKPRGAAPGLVSLASFKTILVEPKVPDFEVVGEPS
jgi:predicted ribosome quality control (RQC) complex YloA/Tae2 family protein